ncbi:NADH-quinone oxidoreductase subunit J family protein [Aquirufa sp. ROCK-SH2]
MINPLTLSFLFLSILTGGSALYMLFTKNLLHAALAMFLCMLGLAGVYVLAYADVLAVSHLMIYVGGVMILLLFGIMLTNQGGHQTSQSNDLWTQHSGKFLAFSIGLTSFLGLIWLFTKLDFSKNIPVQNSSKLRSVGIELLTTYSFPFELAGIFLLIALVGATYIAKNHE